MQNSSKLLSYIPMADFIAKLNGPNCEVVIHDTSNIEQSIIYITSPNLTGRPLGGELTDYAKKLIEDHRYLTQDYEVNYIGSSYDSERLFRSSTYYIREGLKLIGLLCVNIDISHLMKAKVAIEQAMIIDPILFSNEQKETFVASAEALIDIEMDKYKEQRRGERFPSTVKKKIAKGLKEQGVFRIKGAVSVFAQKINVSEQTVYRYIKS